MLIQDVLLVVLTDAWSRHGGPTADSTLSSSWCGSTQFGFNWPVGKLDANHSQNDHNTSQVCIGLVKMLLLKINWLLELKANCSSKLP